AVVRHHAANAHAQVSEPGTGPVEESRAGVTTLRGCDFDIRKPRRIVDGHMRILIAHAAVLPGLVAVNPMANGDDTRERFDIDVQRIARVWPFVTSDGGLGRSRSLDAEPAQDRRDRRGWTPQRAGNHPDSL